jgi:hypothetical protein
MPGEHKRLKRCESAGGIAPALRGGAQVLAALVLCACSGDVDSGQNAVVGGGGSNAGVGNVPGAGVPGAGGTGAPGSLPPGSAGAPAPGACGRQLEAPRAVLLTQLQYAHALRDLLGPTAVSDQMLAEAGEPEIEVIDRPWVTTGVLDRVVRTAEQATETLRGKGAAFTGCTSLTDTACVRTALTKVARRAWKRTPEPAEIDDLMKLHGEALAAIADNGESALLIALQGVLTSPSTLYRTEFRGQVNGTTQTLTAHERAAAVAALLLDSVPDEALLAAADDGSLLQPAGLEAQVTRLLALPAVREHLTALVLNAYRASRVFETLKDEMVFPEYTPALQGAMYDESKRFVDDVVWTRNAPLSELLTSRSTFVNGPLAKLYGIPFSGRNQMDFVPAQMPEGRSGLLTQASVLSVLARTDKTSVVSRGLFVRGALLCLPKIPSPPAEVQMEVAKQLSMNATQKELSEYRAMTSPCNGCHVQFDRFGLMLEGFDPIGKARTPAPDPIDLMHLGSLMGTVANVPELIGVLVEDERFTRCMAEHVLDYSLSTVVGGDAYCDSDPLHQAIAADTGMPGLVRAIVTHPAFATRSHTDM